MVGHLAFMIEVERQEPFFSLARIKDEPHFKRHGRVVRRPERIALSPIDSRMTSSEKKVRKIVK